MGEALDPAQSLQIEAREHNGHYQTNRLVSSGMRYGELMGTESDAVPSGGCYPTLDSTFRIEVAPAFGAGVSGPSGFAEG
jgi:hypothetical protein